MVPTEEPPQVLGTALILWLHKFRSRNSSSPDFPAEASKLRELTLTADIKMDEYQTLVGPQLADAVRGQQPLPNLPPPSPTLRWNYSVWASQAIHPS